MNRHDNRLGKLIDNFGPITPLTSEQIALAQQYVTARSISDDDQRMLFSMLGIEAA